MSLSKKRESRAKKLAKELKQLGLYDGDLRKSMTKGRAQHIESLYGKFKQFVDRPQSFVSAYVSPARAEQIEAHAYSVARRGKKTRLIFKGQKARIKRKSIIVTDGVFEDEIFDAKGMDFLKLAEKLFRENPNAIISAQIGSNAPFKRRFGDFQQFSMYMGDWQPKDDNTDRDTLLSQLSVTKIDQSRIKRHGKKNKGGKN